MSLVYQKSVGEVDTIRGFRRVVILVNPFGIPQVHV
jgi:hypothetical protein